MKYTLSLLFLAGFFAFGQAKNKKPENLYEQLCEVNQEWYKNRPIAKQLGFLQAPVIQNEQDLLVFHIQALEKIFLSRNAKHLTKAQQAKRQQNLRILNEYWKRRDCPRNYYLPYRNPVFIDHEGRYCAVGYLMLKSGKKEFCEAVQRNSNFIYIRQIKSPEFTDWQQQSGLSLDELAWIQPGYDPIVRLERVNRLGVDREPRFVDSLNATKIYSAYYDNTDMFGFQRMFWGKRIIGSKAIKKYKQYSGNPDWKMLKKEHGNISALTVHQGKLYVAVDTTVYDTTFRSYQTKIMRWSSQDKWQQLHKSNDRATIYTFFTNRGKLYAGGGSDINSPSPQQMDHPFSHSYLLCFNGKSWQKIEQEYGGIIFGLIYKNGRRYLGTVNNNMAGNKWAPIHKTKTNK
ncbi:hypothetical protein BKI52_00365 [marine bacterium AO1-C]|nr:hypothetical protein BKI52_00365 [marine bacterium AO1-C]